MLSVLLCVVLPRRPRFSHAVVLLFQSGEEDGLLARASAFPPPPSPAQLPRFPLRPLPASVLRSLAACRLVLRRPPLRSEQLRRPPHVQGAHAAVAHHPWLRDGSLRGVVNLEAMGVGGKARTRPPTPPLAAAWAIRQRRLPVQGRGELGSQLSLPSCSLAPQALLVRASPNAGWVVRGWAAAGSNPAGTAVGNVRTHA